MAANSGDEGAAASRPRRVSPIWPVVVLLIGTFVLVHNGFSYANRGVGLGYMNLGIDPSGCGADGFCKIAGGPVRRSLQGVREGAAVAPDGPLAHAGVREGDALRLDRRMDLYRVWRADETVGATLRRGGASSHVVIKAGAGPPASANDRYFGLDVATCCLTCLIGMFVTLRSSRRASTLLFWSFRQGFPVFADGAPQVARVFRHPSQIHMRPGALNRVTRSPARRCTRCNTPAMRRNRVQPASAAGAG